MKTMKSRRVAGSLAACAVGALLLTSCSGGQSAPAETPSAPAEPVELRMYSVNITQAPMEKFIQAFNDSQDTITMKVQYVTVENLPGLVSTEIQGGNPPDIIGVSAGSGGGAGGLSMETLAKGGKLLQLPNEPWVTDIPDILKPASQFQGGSYAALEGIAVSSIDYATADFTAWGVEAPKTQQEWLNLCGVARANGKYLDAAGGAPVFNTTKLVSFASANVYQKDPEWDKKRAEGKATFANTQGWRDSVQQVVDMVQNDCFAPGAASRGPKEVNELLATGQATLNVAMSSAHNFIKAATPDRASAAAPVPGVSSIAIPVFASGMAVAKQSKHPEAAMEFLKYYTEHADELMASIGSFSTSQFTSGDLPEFFTGLVPYIKDKDYVLAPGTMWPNATVLDTAGKMMTGLFSGQSTVDDVLAAMDQAWDNA